MVFVVYPKAYHMSDESTAPAEVRDKSVTVVRRTFAGKRGRLRLNCDSLCVHAKLAAKVFYVRQERREGGVYL